MAAVADTDTSRNGANHGSDAREKLNEQFSGLMSAIAGRVGSGADSLTDKLSDLGSGGEGGKSAGTAALAKAGQKTAEGKSPLSAARRPRAQGMKEKVKQVFKGKGGGRRQAGKVTNIIETIDIGAPDARRYDQWTQFQDFPSFMKKVEGVEPERDEKTEGATGRPRSSGRTGRGRRTIIEQVPGRPHRLALQGQKGYVDGAVTFPSWPQPDPGLPGHGVLPAGPVRAHRQPLARPGPPRPAGVQALPAARHGRRPAPPRRDRGLARRGTRRRRHS